MIKIHNIRLTERLKDFECMVLLCICKSSIYCIAMRKRCAKIDDHINPLNNLAHEVSVQKNHHIKYLLMSPTLT